MFREEVPKKAISACRRERGALGRRGAGVLRGVVGGAAVGVSCLDRFALFGPSASVWTASLCLDRFALFGPSASVWTASLCLDRRSALLGRSKQTYGVQTDLRGPNRLTGSKQGRAVQTRGRAWHKGEVAAKRLVAAAGGLVGRAVATGRPVDELAPAPPARSGTVTPGGVRWPGRGRWRNSTAGCLRRCGRTLSVGGWQISQGLARGEPCSHGIHVYPRASSTTPDQPPRP